MRILENQIIKDIRNIILDEELEDLRDEYFENKLNVFKAFRNFGINKITKKYIDIFEKNMSEISKENFSEEDFKKLQEEFEKEEEFIKFNSIDDNCQLNKNDKLEIKDRFEILSFSIFLYYTELYKEINTKTADEKSEIYNNCVLIHGYLRNNSFGMTADAVADVKISLKQGGIWEK